MTEKTKRSRLEVLGLPIIQSFSDLSLLTHLSKGLILKLVKFPEKQYLTYDIQKPGGGKRKIYQPSYEMKAVQAWILRNILDKLNTSSACKGFEKYQSIADNAMPHIGANSLLCVDIDNFFPSIRANRIWYIFYVLGYSPNVSANLTSICTYDGFLPQGAPTSPKLANLVCWNLDKRLLGYTGKRRIIYTRYADDLTFSSFSYSQLARSLDFINYVIRDEGFHLNERKTRFAGPSRRHKITGLIVYDKGFGIGRSRYRELRSEIHRLCFETNMKDNEEQINHLRGWLAFTNGVDRDRYNRLVDYIEILNNKHPKSCVAALIKSS